MSILIHIILGIIFTVAALRNKYIFQALIITSKYDEIDDDYFMVYIFACGTILFWPIGLLFGLVVVMVKRLKEYHSDE